MLFNLCFKATLKLSYIFVFIKASFCHILTILKMKKKKEMLPSACYANLFFIQHNGLTNIIEIMLTFENMLGDNCLSQHSRLRAYWIWITINTNQIHFTYKNIFRKCFWHYSSLSILESFNRSF